MIFTELPILGAYTIELNRSADERGFFARTWCTHEFAQRNLNSRLVQCSTSFNRIKGTMRGMHYQIAPFEETKLVRCTAGAVYDAIIDLRRESPTFKRWTSAVLTAENRKMIYIPQGVAHGFLTLQDSAEVLYQMSEFYSAENSRGVRWNDPAFKIEWPSTPIIMSERDRSYPDFEQSHIFTVHC